MPQGGEHELVAAAASGDQAALAQLLTDHQGRLYQVCLRMLGHRDDAAEVCQDALLKVVQHIREFRGSSAISTWMVRIAMNLCVSHLRKRKLRRTVSIEAPLDGSGGGGGGGSGGDGDDVTLRMRLAEQREPTAAACVERKEMLAALHAALQRIDEDFRGVLVLRDIEQMDYSQIAEVLGLPVGTVKSRLFRARLALRRELADVEEGVIDATGGDDGRPTPSKSGARR